jgi:hypothetical protein
MKGKKCDCDVIDITAAAEILGVTEQWARVLLQSPDRVDRSAKGHPIYMYCKTKVEQIVEIRKIIAGEKQKDFGKRSCYLCHKRFAPSELTSGICPKCQAYKWVKNFAHHGDCLAHKADISRLLAVEGALRRFRNHLSKGNAKAI